MTEFKAFRIHAERENYRAGIETVSLKQLSAGDVTIEVHYSSVNYKDALAGTGKGKILRRSPLIGGIDLAGTVVSSGDSRFKESDSVLVTGCGLSEVQDGGYAEYARIPADWVIPVPNELDLFKVMAIGTAGLSAALAVKRMEDNHQTPDLGPVLVTGATGGVGSLAINILSGLGYEVVALTGKVEATDYLKALGATSVLNRHELEMGNLPLERARWGGAIDNVGGETLSWLTRTMKPWGNIVSIGVAGGADITTTVMPFILRGISLIGLTAANCPRDWRLALWRRLGSDLYPQNLATIVTESVSMEQLPDAFDKMLAGKTKGRIVVQIKSDGG